MIIGVNGKRHHGKDTIGVFLKALGFERYAMGDELRRLLYKINPGIGINQKSMRIVFLKPAVDSMGWERVKQMPEVIRLQQNCGNEAREVLGEDVWHRAVQNRMAAEMPGKAVITDVRYLSDVEWVRGMGGHVWRVNRPGYVDPAGEEISRHVSETLLDDYDGFDAIINNDGELQDLKEKVFTLLTAIEDKSWIRGGTL